MDAAETWSLSIDSSIPCLGFDVLQFSSTWYHKHQKWIQRLKWSPRSIYRAAACSSQDVNHLETRRKQSNHRSPHSIPPLGRHHNKDQGFSHYAIWLCCDLPKDGKLIHAIWKSTVTRWTMNTQWSFFICTGIQLGFNKNKLRKRYSNYWSNHKSVGKLTPKDIYSIQFFYSIQFWVDICNAKSCKVQANNHPNPRFREWKNLFCIAIQDAEDNQGTGTSLMCEWSRVNLNTWSTQTNKK